MKKSCKLLSKYVTKAIFVLRSVQRMSVNDPFLSLLFILFYYEDRTTVHIHKKRKKEKKD